MFIRLAVNEAVAVVVVANAVTAVVAVTALIVVRGCIRRLGAPAVG
jgi:hypothetical protein